jgi:hypothetical protein
MFQDEEEKKEEIEQNYEQDEYLKEDNEIDNYNVIDEELLAASEQKYSISSLLSRKPMFY